MSPLEIHMDALNGYYRCPFEWYIQKNIFLIININESKIVAKLFFFLNEKSKQGREKQRQEQFVLILSLFHLNENNVARGQSGKNPIFKV